MLRRGILCSGQAAEVWNGVLRSEHHKIYTSALYDADFQFQQLFHLERMNVYSGLVGVN